MRLDIEKLRQYYADAPADASLADLDLERIPPARLDHHGR